METLTEKLNELIIASGANVSIVVKEVDGPILVSINPETVYHAASTIKVPILYTVLRLWDKGLLKLTDKVSMKNDDKVGGCGILKLMHDESALLIRDLLMLMICISDNTATNLLIDHIGIDIVNQEMTALGLTHTHLARKLMISCPTTYSKTTASDLAILFENFTDKSALSPEALILGKEILLNQQLNNRINRAWHLCGKCGVLIGTDNTCKNCGAWTGDISSIPLHFYHKTGEIVGIEHDAGLLTVNDRFYTIAVLSRGHEDNYEGMHLLSEIGKMIIETLM